MKTRTLISYKNPLGDPVEIVKQTFTPSSEKPGKRISFVAGLHGNELEGVFLCHLLIHRLRRLKETRPEIFRGEINIYPAVNPQAIGAGSRLWPFFSVDMNRLLGEKNGFSLPEELSQALLEDLKASSDWAVDFHASNLHLKELPQIRIIEGFEKKLIPLAQQCNVDIVWVHPTAPVFESTLAFNLNKNKIPALVVEMGISLRIDQSFCDQIFNGMLNLLEHIGILNGLKPEQPAKEPVLLKPSQVVSIQAGHSGLFASRIELGQTVNQGELLGEVVDPVQGIVLEYISAPKSGLVFTLREHPLAYQGTPLARIAIDEN